MDSINNELMKNVIVILERLKNIYIKMKVGLK